MQKSCLVKCMYGVAALALAGLATDVVADSERPATREEFHQMMEERVAQLNAERAAERQAAEDARTLSAERGDGWVCEGDPAVADADFDGGGSMARGSSVVYNDGSLIHDAWHVGGSVEVHRLAFRGQRFRNKVVELNGTSPGGIWQTITGLQPGAYYRLTFDYAIHPDAEEAEADWQIADEDGSLYSTNTADGNWATKSVYFQAWSTSAEVEFESENDGALGMMIDNVQVVCVPPSYIGLELPNVLRNKEGEAVSYTIPTDGGTPSFFESEGLPPGLDLDEETGMVTGTIEPYAAGTYYVEVYVEGQTGDDDDGYFVWEVFSMGGLVLDLPLNEIVEIEDFSGENATDYDYYTFDESPYEMEVILDPDAHVVAGPEDAALMFDEERALIVEPGDHQSLRGEFSFSGWVKSDVDFEDPEFENRGFWPEFILMKGDPFFGAEGGYISYYIVQFYDEIEVGFMLEDEGGEYDIFWAYTEGTPLEQWFHLAVTADDNGWNLYLNGELDMSGEFPDGWRLADMGGVIFAGNVPIFTAGDEDDMTISLDELQVYDRILTAGEIAEEGEQPPFSFTSPGDQTNATGDEVNLPIPLTGPYLWLEVEGFPEGLTFDAGERKIYGELGPCDAGTYEVEIFVVDLDENVYFGDFIWTVTTAPGGMVENWSFEGTPAVPEESFVRYEMGESIYDSWSVLTGNVDVHHVGNNGIGNRLPGDGTQVLELNGDSDGAVLQGIDGLVEGNRYRWSFLYSSHPNARINSATVAIPGTDINETIFAGRGYSPRRSPWHKFSAEFVAEDTGVALFLASLDSGPYGMVIDQVELVCIDGVILHDDHGLPLEPASNQQIDASTWGLSMSRPNPFTEGTTIRFNVAERSPVNVSVFSVDGRRVRTLVDDWVESGSASVDWDGLDEAGRPVSSGTYIIRMSAPNFSQNQRVVRIR